MVIQRELIEGGSAAHVLIIDSKLKKSLMISQFRTGMIGNTESPWSLEAVAGLIDKGETPLEACIRECFEETGVVVDPANIKHIVSAQPSFGDSNKTSHIFIADTDLSNIDETITHGEVSEHEDIKTIILTFDELKSRFYKNEFLQLQDTIAIQRLMLDGII